MVMALLIGSNDGDHDVALLCGRDGGEVFVMVSALVVMVAMEPATNIVVIVSVNFLIGYPGDYYSNPNYNYKDLCYCSY